MTEAERKENELDLEIKALEFQTNNTFKAPPREWIDLRLKELSTTLEQGTVSSSQALKELLGEIKLEPILTKESDNYFIYDGLYKNFKPYYVAHTNIETLALLNKENQGSNWEDWWAGKDSAPYVRLSAHSGSATRPRNLSYSSRFLNRAPSHPSKHTIVILKYGHGRNQFEPRPNYKIK